MRDPGQPLTQQRKTNKFIILPLKICQWLERAWNSSWSPGSDDSTSLLQVYMFQTPSSSSISEDKQWVKSPQHLGTFFCALTYEKCWTPVIIQTSAKHLLWRKKTLTTFCVMTKLWLTTCHEPQYTTPNCILFVDSISINLLECLLLSFHLLVCILKRKIS